MRRLRTFFITTIVISLAFATEAIAAKRIALVVGNGAYQTVPSLLNPPHDASDIAASLRRLNFSVTLVLNGPADKIRETVARFDREAAETEIALVFYAGHGIEGQGENWLIPVDAKVEDGRIDPLTAINLKSIVSAVGKSGVLGLVILDACRDSPLSVAPAVLAANLASVGKEGSSRSAGKGLAPVASAAGNVLVAFAAKDGSTADDGDGRNSPFTAALLRHIETPGLEISNLFRNVRDDVLVTSNGRQQPFVYGSLSKREIFLKPLPEVSSGASPVALKEAANQPVNPIFRSVGDKQIADFAAQKKIPLPLFQINQADPGTPLQFRRFIGAWGSKVGFNSVGRHGMLIVTSVSPSGEANGYYLWGPSTPSSFAQIAAGHAEFASKISGDGFKINYGRKTVEIKMFEGKGIRMRDIYTDGKIATIDLYPVWADVAVPQGRR